jgi:hypothetical protein
MTAVDAEVPRAFNGNREIPIDNQTARAGPDATATGDAQILINFDDRVEFVGIAHFFSIQYWAGAKRQNLGVWRPFST